MKKHYLLNIHAVVALFLLIKPGVIFSDVNNLNPIADLRTPRSLCELLHKDINTIYSSLLSSIGSPDALFDTLCSVAHGFDQLSATYDAMANTTRNHQVHQEDREFLQKMIDRIDRMLSDLEIMPEAQKSQETEEALSSARSSFDAFAAKIS